MIHGFRNRGHLLSTTNPIRVRKDRKPFLDIKDYGLEASDKTKIFQAGLELGLENATLDDILARLNGIYCGNIGFEYAHIENKEKRMWLRQKIEGRQLDKGYGIALDKKKRILSRLNGAVVLEKFLHTKYIGQKRFSLEGGETTIAAIDAIINHGASKGVKEFIIGMAHRGRLNVLANIMGKTYEQIFSEFEGTAVPDLSFGDGDVKYHMGYSSQVKTPDNHKVYLKLVPNPSHLEAVDPVVEGFARAKVDLLYESPDQILPILIHGDAALAGQGVVYETVQMSQLPGYYTGGTIHFVINNQIGFTTDFDDARSSTYSTAAASLVQAPVFHVNGDDPEAVVYAVELAVEYRQKFNNDVFVDMVCYRRHGHNESDDPKFTQPAMYEVIHSHPNPREIYVKHLAEKGDVEQKLAKEMEKSFWANLQARLDEVKQKILPYEYQKPELEWKKLTPSKRAIDFQSSPKTGIPLTKIQHILDKLIELPESFTPLSKVNRLLKNQSKLIKSKKLDWALAELMAYASLLAEGTNIRMSGQDVKRGTFSHRHAIFSDTKTFEKYNRLNPFGVDDATMRIYNSLLSEFAVLGFEYGYSMASPQSLVIWEAQFGDFSNGAQTIVDQFIAASESKWRRMSGLVMLLPHGYEGQGPEHSSARLERFLLMGAEFNITIANCTTPANFFHLIRRQIIRNFRKPLIVMSPKSLLRHPQCISDISHCKTGTAFQEILDDDQVTDKTLPQVKRAIFCSGKVYYDLLQKKVADGRDDVALIRLEQLYPMAKQQMNKIFQKYDHAELFWVQEEPVNMGAWQYLLSFYNNKGFQVISRKSSASPATGFKKIHDEQQDEIIRQAFDF
jgi:2-oxoglutarate dehydrogenase E1 component